MCGISLVIAKNKIDILNFKEFNTIIKHRGPDDEGFVFFKEGNLKFEIAGGSDTPKAVWNFKTSYQPRVTIESIEEEYNIGIGHRRLSILDLSPLGHIPMFDNTERYCITYNGEIYNFIELREELKQLGCVFHTQTDTEVILAAYTTWGEQCQERFNGMWAFAIYDTLKEVLFISRDRFGIKPLYYWFSPEGDFYLASEIKQFTVCKGWQAILNPQRAYDYLFYALTDHTDETLFQGVYHLPAGCSFESKLADLKLNSKDKIAYKKWYQPKYIGYKGSYEDAKAEFKTLFNAAIAINLRADVPIGSALSGGIDSSAIVCTINQILKDKGVSELQQTFSSCSHDERYDERKWMDVVIDFIKVDASFVYPKGQSIFTTTEKIMWHQDEPYQSQSAFLGYYVFEKAKEKGVTVLLNGQGADEYLSGYTDFSSLRKRGYLKRFHFKKLYKELDGCNFFQKLPNVLPLIYHFSPIWFRRKVSHNTKNYKRLLSLIDMKKLGAIQKHPYDYNSYGFNSVFEIAHHQLLYEPLKKYLRWEDRNSMAFSLEARVPFLDHRLVEFTTQLPVAFLDGINESKKILVDSIGDILPERILNRKDKKGFITPEEVWFKNDFKKEFVAMYKQYSCYTNTILREKQVLDYFEQVASEEIPFDYTYWRLISLGVWMKVFDVKTA